MKVSINGAADESRERVSLSISNPPFLGCQKLLLRCPSLSHVLHQPTIAARIKLFLELFIFLVAFHVVRLTILARDLALLL